MSGARPTMALDDLKVIDLTIARAGPTAVKQLADWGADVIRVEPPEKNGAGSVPTARHGADFQNLHRNKRAISLDLKTPEGKEIFFKLVADADVVVENWRAPVKYRLGVDYESLKKINPRIVYGSISGFGQDGPYSDRGGVDQIAQGLGGLMSITGEPDGGPMRVGIAISDVAAGMNLGIAILVALHERERSGEGQWVHTSLVEAMVSTLDFQAARWTVEGEVPGRAGNHHPTNIPMGTFPTLDGHVNIAAPGGRLWESFCTTIGAEDLLTDERYANTPLRSKNRDELNGRIADILSSQTTIHWVEVLNDAGVPCGPVNNVEQTFADPQVQHLGIATDVPHHTNGNVSVVRHAANLTRTPQVLHSASPDPSQHTDEVLTDLGYTDDELHELRTLGVI